MDDGINDFQAATCDISAGDYAAALKKLARAEAKARKARADDLASDIAALRAACDARL